MKESDSDIDIKCISIRLRAANEQLQRQISQNESLLERYRNQISILEAQVNGSDGRPSRTRANEVAIERIDVSRLLEEMRLLRQHLELSINKQNELQIRLDENLRQSRTPREFTFSGRGVSYPDLRLVEGGGALGTDSVPFATLSNEARVRPLGVPSTDLDRGDYGLLSGEDVERTSMSIDPFSLYLRCTPNLFSCY